MRLALSTRHRRLLILTGDDLPQPEVEEQVEVTNTASLIEVAPFGFAMTSEQFVPEDE